MHKISDGYAHGMFSDKNFRSKVNELIEHQEAQDNDSPHQACGGFYVQQAHPLAHLYYSKVRFRHDEAAADYRFGHIPESDWGEVGAYLSVRSRIVPTVADLTQLEELHANNAHAIYGIAAPTPIGSTNILLMRHNETEPFLPEQLENWDPNQKIAAAIAKLVTAGINCRLHGPATAVLPDPGPMLRKGYYI